MDPVRRNALLRARYSANYNEARIYFERAAGQSLNKIAQAESWDWLGVLHCTGKGWPLDYKEALKYFKLAANQDSNKIAQARGWLHLAQMHYEGDGIPADLNEARRYCELAINQNAHIETRNQAKRLFVRMQSTY